MIEIIQFPAFTRRLDAIAKAQADQVLLAIESDLMENPERGDLVPGLAGIRKARTPDPTRGKGKRGGFRYLYYYIEKDGQIFLMFLFNKDEQEDLSPEQKKRVREMVAALKGAKR